MKTHFLKSFFLALLFAVAVPAVGHAGLRHPGVDDRIVAEEECKLMLWQTGISMETKLKRYAICVPIVTYHSWAGLKDKIGKGGYISYADPGGVFTVGSWLTVTNEIRDLLSERGYQLKMNAVQRLDLLAGSRTIYQLIVSIDERSLKSGVDD